MLTHDELEALSALVNALNAIAGSNLPGAVERLADDVNRLRKLVEADEDKAEMQDLAEDLNSLGIFQWADALSRGDRVIERVVLKLADHRADGDERT